MVLFQNVRPTDLQVAPVLVGKANQPIGILAVIRYREIEPGGYQPRDIHERCNLVSGIQSGDNRTPYHPGQITMLRNHDGVWTSLSTTYSGQNGK
ncbi:MAG: hypothetical protein WCF90_02675 [Methanomicrobiales archaeon]